MSLPIAAPPQARTDPKGTYEVLLTQDTMASSPPARKTAEALLPPLKRPWALCSSILSSSQIGAHTTPPHRKKKEKTLQRSSFPYRAGFFPQAESVPLLEPFVTSQVWTEVHTLPPHTRQQVTLQVQEDGDLVPEDRCDGALVDRRILPSLLK